MKILTVIGARPQFVKAAVVSMSFKEHEHVAEVIVHTGQHFDANMSDVFFQEMKIPTPDYHLGIDTLSHGAMTGKMLEGIETILLDEKPDYLMVYGDTNSTLAGSLAAAKLHIPVIHVEAGLRSFDMRMPEEINRIVTDRLASILYCPTDAAVENLEKEGFADFDCEIIKNGDVMQDAAIHFTDIAAERSDIIERLGLDRFVLATLHRAENTDDPSRLTDLISSLEKINEEIPVLMPLHPRTAKLLKSSGLNPAFKLIDPVGYLDMLQLLENCSLVLTDSGGLQKEAFFFKKHCLTLRDQTEWIELVENGFNMVVGADPDKVIHGYEEMINKTSDFSLNLYGNGQAASLITEHLAKKSEARPIGS